MNIHMECVMQDVGLRYEGDLLYSPRGFIYQEAHCIEESGGGGVLLYIPGDS